MEKLNPFQTAQKQLDEAVEKRREERQALETQTQQVADEALARAKQVEDEARARAAQLEAELALT